MPTDTSFVPIAPVPGLDCLSIDANSGRCIQSIPTNTQGIAYFLNNLYVFAIGIAVTLAVLMIVWGGIEYALSSAEITKKSEGKRRIQNALYGLVLVLAPAVVFAIINPAILNLDVNFPALQTPWQNGSAPIQVQLGSQTTPSGGNTNTSVCGSDGCANQITACPNPTASSCLNTAGTFTYDPGAAGAAAGQCKPGDVYRCYEGAGPY
ncbi:MAG: hypothetical protein KGI78_00260 [Patescibacteria group bacterium]|nr:hypothetical protein [Patescibacteria group bacterium]MDE1944066.1 hypothetical protein [Patescibacteria group bacterium]MDE1944727.1 hypothetical protein [Patescibacteria group bacterium]MDE2057271.1 hypothetical protein [Patescibacteria group bacterium]